MTEPDVVAELDRWLQGASARLRWVESDMIRRARDELATLREALDESLKLQSHYAVLLNNYDGGKRLQFGTGREWLDRLRALKDKAHG